MTLICHCPSFGENLYIPKDILTIILSESNKKMKMLTVFVTVQLSISVSQVTASDDDNPFPLLSVRKTDKKATAPPANLHLLQDSPTYLKYSNIASVSTTYIPINTPVKPQFTSVDNSLAMPEPTQCFSPLHRKPK